MKKILIQSFVGIVFLGIILIAVLVVTDGSDFFKGIIQVISILSALFISFCLVQWITECRNERDFHIRKIRDMQNRLKVNEKIMSTNRTIALWEHTMIGNEIEYLCGTIKKKEAQKDLEKIEEEFKEFRTIYGNHCENMQDLERAKHDMERQIDIICDKLSKMEYLLYFKRAKD